MRPPAGAESAPCAGLGSHGVPTPARWMSQLVYNGLSLFGVQDECSSAALITKGMQRGGEPSPSSGRCHRELGNVIRGR
jgi:hypothetical protein